MARRDPLSAELNDPWKRTLLDSMPHGGLVIEVGVWKGAFAAEMLQHVQPDRLVLVDQWQHFDDPLDPDKVALPQSTLDDVYRGVVDKFMEDRRVCVLRASSLDAAMLFRFESASWLYLDACHQYEAVKADLMAWWPVVVPGGFFCGHDYAPRWGVVQAVDEFVATTAGCRFVEGSFGRQFVLEKAR